MPPATVRLRAAQVVDEQRAKMFANVAATVEGRDPEGVHDMRVATRRLRAGLKLFSPWLDSGDVGRVAPAVRRLTRALGGVRELDVLRLGLAGLAARASAERALAIECVDARLARRRRRAREKMMAGFAKVGLDRLEGRLRRLTAQLERHARSTPAAGEAATALAAGEAAASGAAVAPPAPAQASSPGAITTDQPIVALLDTMAGTLVAEAHEVCHPALPQEIGTQASAEALHATRIAAKKLRYALEVVAPYLGDAGAAAVRRLRGLQDKLGEFHDDTVLDDVLRAEIERALARERPLLARELKRLRAARRRVLTRDERTVRQAVAELRDAGFVALIAGALRASGATVEVSDGAAHGGEAASGGDEAAAAQPERAAAQQEAVPAGPPAGPGRWPRAPRKPRKTRSGPAALGAAAGSSSDPASH